MTSFSNQIKIKMEKSQSCFLNQWLSNNDLFLYSCIWPSMTWFENQVLSRPWICIFQIPWLSRFSMTHMDPVRDIHHACLWIQGVHMIIYEDIMAFLHSTNISQFIQNLSTHKLTWSLGTILQPIHSWNCWSFLL